MSFLWVLLAVIAQAAEIDITSSTILAGQWNTVLTFPVSRGSKSVELDLDIYAHRSGIVGWIVDLFDLFIPSSFSVKVTDENGTRLGDQFVFNRTVESLSAVIPVGVHAESLRLLIKNQNTFFTIEPRVFGQIFSSSDQFDLRTAFPSCPFPVYSQQMCGACYADVVAGAGTDELCMTNSGSPLVNRLSPQPIISCAGLGGCAGGSPYLATVWTQSHGLWESSECPYMSGKCYPEDDVGKNGCIDCKSLGIPKLAGSYRFRPIVLMRGSESAIRKHIQQNGSVMVIFVAHANFQEYFHIHPFGIYSSVNDSPEIGNHAVRLVGFGIEDGKRYWIALNSWGSGWANRGSFKIARGENIGGIELYPVGVAGLEYPSAGLGEKNAQKEREIDYPVIGEWRAQNVSDPYWATFVVRNRDLIKDEVGEEEVASIETKVSHGFHVKLRFQRSDVTVVIHVSPEGLVSVDNRSKQLRKPESIISVVAH